MRSQVHGPASKDCDCRIESRLQFAQPSRWREVFVFGRDANLFDTLARCETCCHFVDELFWCRRSRSHTDDSGKILRKLVCLIDSVNLLTSRFSCEALQGSGIRRIRRPDHHDRITARCHRHEGRLAICRGETQITSTGSPDLRELLLHSDCDFRPISMRQSRLGEKSDRSVEIGKGFDFLDRLHARDRFRGNCHRSDRLFVTFVPDINDSVPLAGANFHLMMDFGDQGTHRIDND